MTWPAVLSLAAGTYLIRLLGLLLRGRVRVPAHVERYLDLGATRAAARAGRREHLHPGRRLRRVGAAAGRAGRRGGGLAAGPVRAGGDPRGRARPRCCASRPALTRLATAAPRWHAGPVHCLVIGATGYVGSRLVPRLLDDGHAVRCLVRDPAKLGRRSPGRTGSRRCAATWPTRRPSTRRAPASTPCSTWCTPWTARSSSNATAAPRPPSPRPLRTRAASCTSAACSRRARGTRRTWRRGARWARSCWPGRRADRRAAGRDRGRRGLGQLRDDPRRSPGPARCSCCPTARGTTRSPSASTTCSTTSPPASPCRPTVNAHLRHRRPGGADVRRAGGGLRRGGRACPGRCWCPSRSRRRG